MKVIEQFKNSPESSLSIFLLHGVIKNRFKKKNSVLNYNKKHLEVRQFKFFLNEILKYGKPLSMDEVYELILYKKKILKKSFAITFDDGFENNISIAAPILLKKNVPFTLYITTNFIDKNMMSWIDFIDYAVEKTKAKSINEFNTTFKLTDFSDKIFFLNTVRSIIKNDKKINPHNFAKKICNKLDVKKFPSNLEIYKKMDWNQLKKLSKNKLCTIGGHSHTHKILGYLNNKDLDYEIKKTLFLIKKNLNINAYHYSYPEGFKKSFSKNVIKSLKKFKIKCCPTAIPGINTYKSNPFLLKRINVV
jgi:peptidoglycan/xylan/chitin deacetylase (PgdA/CDA1 family)